MTSLPRSAMMRLQRDYKQLMNEPLVGTHAEPTDDLSMWNGCLQVPLNVGGREEMAPLHFRIEFPPQYPNSPPNIGFTSDFGYNMGASYIEQSGRLRGCKVICLDLLGNFGDIHTEWKAQEGSGWSPAYNVSTLLLNLQSVVTPMGSSMSQRDRQKLIRDATKFQQEHPDSVPKVLSAEEVTTIQRKAALTKKLGPLTSFATESAAFAIKAGLLKDQALVDEFVHLIENLVTGGTSSAHSGGAPAKRRAPPHIEVDTNIVCYSTGKLYTEGILGYGISITKRGRQVNLSTPGELLSLEAYNNGLRQSTSKIAFEVFLPAFINERHASKNPKWVKTLAASVLRLGGLYPGASKHAALAVFPKLINTMLADIMSPETTKTAAIAYFEALLSFWRTFHYLLKADASLAQECRKRLQNFVSEEKFRLKSNTPDVGAFFAMYACCPGGAPRFADFLAAYVDEAYIRSSLYWRRNRTPLEARALFEATKVGRDIAMFQSLFVQKLIGSNPAETAVLMDQSNGKLPSKLEELQTMWRRHLAETKNWATYFRRLGLDGRVGKPICSDIPKWARSCLDRASTRGSAYTGERAGGSSGRGRGGDRGGRGGGYQRYNGNGNGRGGGRGGYRRNDRR